MPVPRPKILTPVTFAAGVDFQFNVSVADTLDTTCTATVPAGTYYVSWDGQSDDLLRVLQEQLAVETNSAGLGFDGRPNVYIDDNNKVVIHFCGDYYVDGTYENDCELLLTSSNADLVAALGFDDSSDVSSTGTDRPTFTADYQHGYGWYADTDGQLDSLLVEDRNVAVTPQSISLSGRVTSQNIAERYTNELQLGWLTRAQTFSRSVAYGAAPVEPYARNVPLECWWREAMEGTEFRVYREGRNGYGVFIETGLESTGDTSTIIDSAKSWSTEPQELKGFVAHSTFRTHSRQRMFVSSHDATSLTAPSVRADGADWCTLSTRYWVLDHRYETYVVDLTKMKEFAPREATGIDYYGITIPLLRYES